VTVLRLNEKFRFLLRTVGPPEIFNATVHDSLLVLSSGLSFSYLLSMRNRLVSLNLSGVVLVVA
jgi:hypothetical protein